MYIGRRSSILCLFEQRMFKGIKLPVYDGIVATDQDDTLVVLQFPGFIWSKKLPSEDVIIPGTAPLPAFGFPTAFFINGAFSQALADIFMGGLLITAQINQRIAVARYGFPGILKQSLDLRKVLYDDDTGDLTGPHRT